MACSKYTLTNTGTTIVNFNYRRCDDSMWEYQVNLQPNETKNIWLINGTYGAAPLYNSVISLVNNGAFPPLNATLTPTPTPTVTPTGSGTPTPTPTNTETPTPTPSNTATNTPTPSTTSPVTPTPTNTNTPTPTTTLTTTPTPSTTSPVTPTPTNTNTPTNTQTPTNTTTPTPTPTPVYPGSISYPGSFFTVAPGVTVGTSGFSVEFWYKTSEPSNNLNGSIIGSPADNLGIVVYGNQLRVRRQNQIFTYTLPYTLSADTWTYFAVARTGTTENVWMGTGATAMEAGIQIDNRDYSASTTNIGYYGAFLTGKTADLKINVGTSALDPNSATIPVPTQKLTADANTKLLLNSNTAGTYLVDSSGNQTVDQNFGVTFSTDSPYPH
jgi:hypothetical protein